jgi:hypothetical protein
MKPRAIVVWLSRSSIRKFRKISIDVKKVIDRRREITIVERCCPKPRPARRA